MEIYKQNLILINKIMLRKAERPQVKLKMAISGSSGSWKTMSALKLAYWITGDWNKIAIIDTENKSADLYADMWDYNVLPLSAPFTPENYIKAIEECEKAWMDVIIVDSISHEWDWPWGILEIHSSMTWNSFTNWSKITPRHNKFVNKMLQSPSHIIATMRVKTDYAINANDKGKQAPEKVWLKPITRDGIEYEFTIVFDVDINHYAKTSKNRTWLFGSDLFIITEETGKQIVEWNNMWVVKQEPIDEDTWDQLGDFDESNYKLIEAKIDSYKSKYETADNLVEYLKSKFTVSKQMENKLKKLYD